MSIAENIQAIRRRMAAAAEKAGRDPRDILLVGASKMNGADACRAAIEAGIDALGENRVQEMTAKLQENAYEGAPLHFIGHLQRNKVRQVVGRVSLIHSVSSVELLEEIHRQAQKQGVIQDILLEVNIGGEESKSGFSPETVYAGAEHALTLPGVRVRGLMTIPPVEREPHGNLPYFAEVSRLYVDISRNLYNNGFTYLSMGMSGDFEDAIAARCMMIRVGSAIFGQRQYHMIQGGFHMSIKEEIMKFIRPVNDEDEEDYVDFDDQDSPFVDDRARPERERSFVDSRRGKVVNIHATTQLKVVLVTPERFETASEIADHLKAKHTVVMNLESTHKDVARRLVDFLSGVAYAGEGKIKKVAANTYIITPYSVDIQGDLIDELENNGLYF